MQFVKQILNLFKLEFIDLLENVHNKVFLYKCWQVKPIPVYKSIGLCITFKVNKSFGTCPKKGKYYLCFGRDENGQGLPMQVVVLPTSGTPEPPPLPGDWPRTGVPAALCYTISRSYLHSLPTYLNVMVDSSSGSCYTSWFSCSDWNTDFTNNAVCLLSNFYQIKTAILFTSLENYTWFIPWSLVHF